MQTSRVQQPDSRRNRAGSWFLGTPEPLPDYRRLTTGAVARMLDVTPRWVRWLAAHRQLACERTRSGVALFREGEVLRFMEQQAKTRAGNRAQHLRAVRLRMLQVGGHRQPRLRLVES
jgi:hypothetical protein